MPALRLSGVKATLGQSWTCLLSPPSAPCAVLHHARLIRTRAGPRRRTGPSIDVEGRSRPHDEHKRDDTIEDDAPDVTREDIEKLMEEDEEFSRPPSKRRRLNRRARSRKVHMPAQLHEMEDEDMKFFEQEGEEARAGPRKPSEPTDPFSQAFEDEEGKIDEDIEGAEQELKELDMDDRRFLPDPEEEAKLLFTPEQRENLQKSFMAGLKDIAPDATNSYDTFSHYIEPKRVTSPSSKLFLMKLNDALDNAALHPEDDGVQRTLWRYYERSKIYVPDIVKMIPDPAWQLLWATQADESPDNPARASHLKTLSQDMVKAGKVLSEEQRFARLEGLFWDGKRDEALVEWEKSLKEGDAGNAEFLELGIRMYAFDRNLKRAEELVDVLFKLHTDSDPRILLQVIAASIGLESEEGYKSAWKLYQRLRQVLTTDIKMEDFDTISLDFLRVGQKDYALAVFRDMMLVGEERKHQGGFLGAVARLGAYMSASKDVEDVNVLGLDSLKYLPRQYQNKWFYASWMRKLLTMGQNGAAAQVMELMYERDAKPDAKHVNGLINGWLRTSHRPSHLQAEKMAWAMIQRRLDFVAERHARIQTSLHWPPQSIHTVPSPVEGDPGQQPVIPHLEKKRRVPAATIETFSLMVQWYLRRSMFANVQHLRHMLVAAEIPMNAYFMNHLLYAEQRNRTYREVWARFESMSADVDPDIETFVCLWECMKQHVDPSVNRDPRGFPRPRELLRRMRKWFHGMQGQQKRDALTDFDIDGYNDVIRAFCISRDPAGSLVALQALHEMFGLAPEETTIRMLTLQIVRLGMYKPRTHKQARKLSKSEAAKANEAQTMQVLDMIVQFRTEAYRERHYELEDFTEEQKNEENHRTALQLLYTVVKEMHERDSTGASNEEAGEEVDADAGAIAKIQEAASDAGLGNFDVESSMGLVI